MLLCWVRPFVFEPEFFSMSRAQAFLGILVLTSIAAFAQKSDTKPAEPGGVTGSQAPSAASADPCVSERQFGPSEILTDTMGVDFRPYLTNAAKTVRQNWYGAMPQSAYPPTSKQGRVAIEFVVQKNGKIDKMKIDTPSGDWHLDRAAWVSVINSSPLPPLPKEFPGQEIGLRFHYFYNLRPEYIYISPCIDVRVPVGSTLQFSIPIWIARADVTWSVSGSACEKVLCGTISENGLYTAPAYVPDPPTVFVEATLRGDRSFPARIKVTVVRADPPH